MTKHEIAARSERVIVITGAAQGLGRMYAQRFSELGHPVVALDVNAEALEKLKREIEVAGGECLALTSDIGNEQSVREAAEQIQSRFGRADVLINNAAIFSTLKMRPFEEIPLEEWNRVLHVNITGSFLVTRALVPMMRRNGWGRIVNVSSAALLMGRPNYLHYTTSKSALIGMTRSMARELGPAGITVNALLPGATDTEIERETVTPAQKQTMIAMRCIPREETMEDLTGVVLFLASEESRFVTGQSISVDGGTTFL